MHDEDDDNISDTSWEDLEKKKIKKNINKNSS